MMRNFSNAVWFFFLSSLFLWCFSALWSPNNVTCLLNSADSFSLSFKRWILMKSFFIVSRAHFSHVQSHDAFRSHAAVAVGLVFWVICVYVWSFASLLGVPKMTCLCLFCMWQCVCWKRGSERDRLKNRVLVWGGLFVLWVPAWAVAQVPAWRDDAGHGSVQTDGVGPCQSPCLLVELIAEARASLSALCSTFPTREAHVMLWIFRTVFLSYLFFFSGGCFRWRGEGWNNVSWSRGELSVARWP